MNELLLRETVFYIEKTAHPYRMKHKPERTLIKIELVDGRPFEWNI